MQYEENEMNKTWIHEFADDTWPFGRNLQFIKRYSMTSLGEDRWIESCGWVVGNGSLTLMRQTRLVVGKEEFLFRPKRVESTRLFRPPQTHHGRDNVRPSILTYNMGQIRLTWTQMKDLPLRIP